MIELWHTFAEHVPGIAGDKGHNRDSERDCMNAGGSCGRQGHSFQVRQYHHLPTLGGLLSAIRGRTLTTPALHMFSDAHRYPLMHNRLPLCPGPPPLHTKLLSFIMRFFSNQIDFYIYLSVCEHTFMCVCCVHWCRGMCG